MKKRSNSSTRRTHTKIDRSTSPTENIKRGTIESMSFGGRGVFKAEGKVFFIEGAFPEDTIEASIRREKKNFGEGFVKKYIKKSPFRVPSPCKYSEQCGGCQWLEAPSEHQQNWKTKFIDSALSKIAKTNLAIDQFIPSPRLLNYRNRVSLKGRALNGRLEVGYYAAKSHKLITIDSCAIANGVINTFIKGLTEQTFPVNKPFNFDLHLQVIKGDKLLVEFSPEKNLSRELQNQIISSLSVQPVVKNVIQAHNKERKTYIYDHQFELDYWTYQGQFQQVNLEANHILRTMIKDIVDEIEPKFIVDLYCGSGNLSLHLSSNSRRILGVELNPDSIRTAKKNLEHNNLKNAQYLNISSESFLKSKLPQEARQPDLVIVDPPRRGLESAITDLIRINARHIIYVSCDPNTLARDLKILTDEGYTIEKVLGMDFFPSTYHVESLAILKLS